MPDALSVYCEPGLITAIDATDVPVSVTEVVAPVPGSDIIRYGESVVYPEPVLFTRT